MNLDKVKTVIEEMEDAHQRNPQELSYLPKWAKDLKDALYIESSAEPVGTVVVYRNGIHGFFRPDETMALKAVSIAVDEEFLVYKHPQNSQAIRNAALKEAAENLMEECRRLNTEASFSQRMAQGQLTLVADEMRKKADLAATFARKIQSLQKDQT